MTSTITFSMTLQTALILRIPFDTFLKQVFRCVFFRVFIAWPCQEPLISSWSAVSPFPVCPQKLHAHLLHLSLVVFLSNVSGNRASCVWHHSKEFNPTQISVAVLLYLSGWLNLIPITAWRTLFRAFLLKGPQPVSSANPINEQTLAWDPHTPTRQLRW